MSEEELRQIRERRRAITPGQWHHGQNIGGQHNVWAEGGIDITPAWVDTRLCQAMREEDCEFISHAPEDTEKLLAEIDRLRAENRELRNLCFEDPSR